MNKKIIGGAAWLVAACMLMLSGGSAEAGQKISQTFPPAVSPSNIDYTPDGRWVVYRANSGVGNTFELYVIDLENNFLNQKVNVGAAAGSLISWTIYDNLLVYSVGTSSDNRMFASTLPLTAPVELTPLTGGVTSWDVDNMQVNASQSTVVFRADRTANGVEIVQRLFSVPLTGGTVTQINAPLDSATQTVAGYSFLGEQEVIYQTGISFGSSKLYRVNVDGSPAVQISLPAGANSDVREYRISSSGDYVVYRGDLLTALQFEVFSTHLPTLQIDRVSAGMSSEEDVISFNLFDDSDRIVYEVGNSMVTTNFLRSRSLGVNDEIVLSGQPDFGTLRLTNTATGRLVYSRNSGTLKEFRSVPVDGNSDVSLAFPYTGVSRYLVVSPQSGFVAVGFNRLTERRELFINRPNGSGLRQLALGNNSVPFSPEFTMDDAALLFAQVDGGVQELISYDTASREFRVLDRVDQFGQTFAAIRTSPVDPEEVVYMKDVQPLFFQNEIWLASEVIGGIFSDGFD